MQTKTKTKTKAAKNNVRQRVKHRLRTETFLEMDRRMDEWGDVEASAPPFYLDDWFLRPHETSF